jgi:outer membrane immunogenic protein
MVRKLTTSLKGVALVAMLGASSALAQEAPSRTVWEGAYLGLHGGAGLGTAGSLSTGGTLLGAQGGYNFQAGQIVGGGEIDATASQIKNSSSSESFSQKWLTSGRARAGFVFGNLLTYGTFGAAASTTNYTNTYSTDVFKVGLVYGGGVEAMIMPHVVLRGELLRYDIGSSSYVNSSGQSVSLDTQSNVFRFGISYKF